MTILDGVAAVIAAVTVLLPVLAKFIRDMRRLRQDFGGIWRGIVARGYVEAVQKKLLVGPNIAECWTVSPDARAIYDPIAAELREICQMMRRKFRSEPTDEGLAWAIEQRFQQWMIDHACPSLGLNQHGCIAIACVIARETTDGVKES